MNGLPLKLQPLVPSSFSYDTTKFEGWLLYGSVTGSATLPLWDLRALLPGLVEWQIDPALTDAFELMTSASGGAPEGTIRKKNLAHPMLPMVYCTISTPPARCGIALFLSVQYKSITAPCNLQKKLHGAVHRGSIPIVFMVLFIDF